MNRLVELDKLRLTTRKEETKELAAKGSADPSVVIIPPSASKGGVLEKIIKVRYIIFITMEGSWILNYLSFDSHSP